MISDSYLHKFTKDHCGNRTMRWKRRRWRRSETAADKYNNQLIAAVEEMAEAATAMAVAMVTVRGHYDGGDGDDKGEDDV